MSIKYATTGLCSLAGISRSGYYKWLSRDSLLTDRDKENIVIKNYILELHNKYRGTYGRKESAYI